MWVDIVIPAYNPGKELVDAVRSCLGQSYKKYSVIVVDDHSDIDVKKLLWDFPSIKYIRNDKNLGPGGARNVGIKASEADCISFLDADDIMHEDKLKLSTSVLSKREDIGMVCGNYKVMVDREKLLRAFYKKPIRVDHALLMRQNFVASGSVTVRRSVFDDVGFFDETLWIAEDYDMWVRISERYNIEYLHKILYYYSVIPNGNSLTQRDDIQLRHNDNIRKIKQASMERLAEKYDRPL
jgi:glycosyltransferase involved in cell wall biosynthesis